MSWKTGPTLVAILLAFATLVWWQHREYVQECELSAQTLRRQSHSVMNALLGGIRTHRRRGRFFTDQLQGSLDGLASTKDILAVGISDAAGQPLCWAGQAEGRGMFSPTRPGEFWDPDGFRLVRPFELPPVTDGYGGGGGGGGAGRRLGASFGTADDAFPSGVFSAGGQFTATLLLDRSPYDAQCRRAAWLRGTVVAAGTLLLLGTSLAWSVTLKAAGRTRLLETEARHLRDLGQAAAGLAHETRNPLGLIRGWAQRLAQAGFDSAAQQEQAESIVEECDRVTARINQFLAFARPRQPDCQSVGVAELLEELSVILEPDLDAQGITLDRRGIIQSVAVKADRELLRQALFNLLQNAIQASPREAAVDVTLQTRQDGSGRIEVADRGSSVPEEAVTSLFTPYFTTRPGGTGLGLAIVRHIANVHGWQAGYTPRPGGGSVFWLDGLHAG
jgi:two-component system, NtrC family, sensor histidine kinase HydH